MNSHFPVCNQFPLKTHFLHITIMLKITNPTGHLMIAMETAGIWLYIWKHVCKQMFCIFDCFVWVRLSSLGINIANQSSMNCTLLVPFGFQSGNYCVVESILSIKIIVGPPSLDCTVQRWINKPIVQYNETWYVNWVEWSCTSKWMKLDSVLCISHRKQQMTMSLLLATSRSNESRIKS